MRGALSLRAVITGRVQGVGFRPFVFRLAKSLGVTGKVTPDDAVVRALTGRASIPGVRVYSEKIIAARSA